MRRSAPCERCGNAGTMIPAGMVERGERKQTVTCAYAIGVTARARVPMRSTGAEQLTGEMILGGIL